LTVHLTGYGTQWVQDQTTVSLGAGVTVGNITVNDSTHITLKISIAGLASPGYRNITVTTGATVEYRANGFYVNAL